jgi:hypothetical protein
LKSSNENRSKKKRRIENKENDRLIDIRDPEALERRSEGKTMMTDKSAKECLQEKEGKGRTEKDNTVEIDDKIS